MLYNRPRLHIAHLLLDVHRVLMRLLNILRVLEMVVTISVLVIWIMEMWVSILLRLLKHSGLTGHVVFEVHVLPMIDTLRHHSLLLLILIRLTLMMCNRRVTDVSLAELLGWRSLELLILLGLLVYKRLLIWRILILQVVQSRWMVNAEFSVTTWIAELLLREALPLLR